MATGVLESGAARANTESAPKCVSKLGEKERGRGRGVVGAARECICICIYLYMHVHIYR